MSAEACKEWEDLVHILKRYPGSSKTSREIWETAHTRLGEMIKKYDTSWVIARILETERELEKYRPRCK